MAYSKNKNIVLIGDTGLLSKELNKSLKKQNNQKTKILLQIHDELIFETPKEEVKRITKVIAEEMSSVATSDQHSFSIPLTVDLNSGDNWGMLH